MKILSWGGGVQSTALAVMSALGEVEKLDAVIFSDTGWERKKTYEAVQFYSKWLLDRGMNVEIVQAGNIREQGATEHIHIPFWTSDGGPLRRQCTRHFKIIPVKRKIRELLGYHPTERPHPKPESVELWQGISYDELERMKDSRLRFIVHRFPLVEQRITRNHCIDYLNDLGLPVPIKSACIGCPYRQASEWIELRLNAPEEWADAVAFDKANRNNPLAERGGSTADELFVYKKAEPLATADLALHATKQRKGKQLAMFCDGFCGV